MGAFAPSGLSDAHRSRLARMQRAVLGVRGGRAETSVSTSSSVVAVREHPNDAVCVTEDGTARVAWIGRTPEPAEGIDGQMLLRALQRRDDAVFRELCPPFAAVVQTVGPDALWLISDPQGLHPLYYCHRDGLLAFCSKLSPLLRSGLIPWSIDPRAILDLFTYEHVTGNRTLADSVEVLPPGSIVRIHGENAELRTYAELPSKPPSDRHAHIVDALHDALSSSVARAMRGRPRVAITLSGGLDSRALLGCAIENASDVRTFTFGTPDCRDVLLARKLAKRLGLSHAMVEIDGRYLLRWLDHGIHATGGMVSCLQFHILALADRLASEADLVLDGLGGDALTGGHLAPAMIAAWSREQAIEALYRQRATGWATPEQREGIFNSDFLSSFDYDPRAAAEKHFHDLRSRPYWWGCHRFDLIERQRRFVQYGPHQLRPFLDVQTPFYAPPLIALMTAARSRDLFNQRAYLRMQVRHFRPLAEIPDSALGVPLSWPASLRFAKRTAGFLARRLPRRATRPRRFDSPTDYPGWFRNELRELVEDRLAGGRSAITEFVQSQAVDRLVREHVRGEADHSLKLGCLLTLDGWIRSLAEG